MKATGIVRRIDDLGRVVIPKEIRRTLRIKEGTPLEIFTDREGEIILKKYSPIGELSIFAKEYTESSFSDDRFDFLYRGSRSNRGNLWKWKQGVPRKRNQPGTGSFDWRKRSKVQ